MNKLQSIKYRANEAHETFTQEILMLREQINNNPFRVIRNKKLRNRIRLLRDLRNAVKMQYLSIYNELNKLN